MAVSMSLVTSMDGTLNAAMQATGDIKVFQIVVSVIMLSDIPLAYLLLSMGVEPYLATGVSICTAILCLIAKLLIFRKQVKYDFFDFLFSIVCKNFIILAFVIFIFVWLSRYIANSLLGFGILCVLSVIVNGSIIYVIGFNVSERKMIQSIMKQTIKRFKH